MEFSSLAYLLPREHLHNRYADLGHGCRLRITYPLLWNPQDLEFSAYDRVLQENMIACIEHYVGAKDGDEGVKLEPPIWITRKGPTLLSDSPIEDSYA